MWVNEKITHDEKLASFYKLKKWFKWKRIMEYFLEFDGAFFQNINNQLCKSVPPSKTENLKQMVLYVLYNEIITSKKNPNHF